MTNFLLFYFYIFEFLVLWVWLGQRLDVLVYADLVVLCVTAQWATERAW